MNALFKCCTRCRKLFYAKQVRENFALDSKTEDGYGTRCKRCKAYTSSPAQQARRDKRRNEKDKKKCNARERARHFYRNMALYCAVINCANKANDFHHVDYDKPIDVVPLCKRHHKGIHESE